MNTEMCGSYANTQHFLDDLDGEGCGAHDRDLGALGADPADYDEPAGPAHGDGSWDSDPHTDAAADYDIGPDANPDDEDGYGAYDGPADELDSAAGPRPALFGLREAEQAPETGALDSAAGEIPSRDEGFDDPDELAVNGPVEAALDPSNPPRFNKPFAIACAAVVAVVTIGLAATMWGVQSTPTTAGAEQSPTTTASAPPAAPIPAPAAAPVNDPTQDVPIPFQASSPCPQAGAGSAQNVASDDPTRAWVCMRDSDGQVLTLDMGKPMKVTAISLTPGWVGTDASGEDQWMQHRVVTRAQWILINGADRTVVTQDTNNAHGPVVQPMPSNGPDQGVLASRIQMIVLQTSRPPADTTASQAPGAGDANGGGMFDDILGAPLGGGPSPQPAFDPPSGTDPVDHTVAISSIKIIGHPPL